MTAKTVAYRGVGLDVRKYTNVWNEGWKIPVERTNGMVPTGDATGVRRAAGKRLFVEVRV